MKKYILLALMICMYFFCSGQSKEYLRTMYNIDLDSTGRTMDTSVITNYTYKNGLRFTVKENAFRKGKLDNINYDTSLYNTKGELTEDHNLFQFFNPANTENRIFYYSKDSSKNSITEYDDSSGHWIKTHARIHYPDQYGNDTEYIEQARFQGIFSDQFHIHNRYIYNSAGKLLNKKFYVLDIKKWLEEGIDSLIYDTNQNLVEEYVNRIVSSMPFYDTHIIYTNDSSGNNTYSYTECLTAPSQSFQPEWRSYFSYNIANSLLSEFSQEWDTIRKAWICGDSTSRAYNMQGDISEDIYYKYIKGKWSYGYRQVYVYDTATSLSDRAEMIEAPLIYPDPAQDILYVKACSSLKIIDISIYDLGGRKLLSKNFSLDGSEESIRVGSLPKGMYLLQMNSQKGTSVQKFIKE